MCFSKIPFLTRRISKSDVNLPNMPCQNYRYYYLLTAISNCNIYIIFYVTLFDISNPEPVKLNFRTILPSPFTSGKWFLTWCEAILKDQSVAKSEKKSIYTFQVYWQVHILKNQLQWKWKMCFVSTYRSWNLKRGT